VGYWERSCLVIRTYQASGIESVNTTRFSVLIRRTNRNWLASDTISIIETARYDG
jgi:hypothetical protein